MRGAALVACWGALMAQTLPRPAGPLEFTLLATGAAARLTDYKNRVVALYLFSPD